MGRLIGICRVEKLGEAPILMETAAIDRERGIAGDTRGRMPGRQVTILFRDGWEAACREAGADLSWTARRANLYVEGMVVPPAGTRLAIGDVLLEVASETEPCEMMERTHKGLQAAMVPDWRGGVCCVVLASGGIRLGDAVTALP